MRVGSGLVMTHDSYHGLAGAAVIIVIIGVSLCVEKGSVITYHFEAKVLCLSISIFHYFILPLNYSLEANIILFTPLHVFNTFRY